jgi:phosphatidylglycerophosphate synthase
MSAGRIANALSIFRLIVSTATALYVAFTAPNWWWFVGIGVLVVASFTEPIDGRIARMGTPAKNGKWMNEVGSMGLSILLPTALLVHQLIGRFWLHWPGATTSNLVVWFAECVIFLAATLFVFNRAKSLLVPDKAERFEVWQAWFTAIIVVCCLQEMFQLGWYGVHGVKPPHEVISTFWAAVVGGLVITAALSGDRLLKRTDERNKGLYTGTKQHLYRRG